MKAMEVANNAATHFYEEKNCSGTFMYAVDDCKPSSIRFSARITIKIILDDDTNSILKEGDPAILQNNEYLIKTFPKDGGTDSVYADKNGHKKNSKPEDKEFIPNESFISTPTNLQNVRENSLNMYQSPKEITVNEEDNLSSDKECEQSDYSENCSSKYNFRQRESKPNDLDNCFIRNEHVQEKEKSVDKSVKQKSSTSYFTEQKSNSKRSKGKKLHKIEKAKTLLEHLHKFVPKAANQKMNITSQKERKSRRKQVKPKPRKLLMSQNLKCEYCDVTFHTKFDFYNHRRNKGSIFRCKVCGKEEPFKAHLMAHMLSHEPDKGYVDAGGPKKDSCVKRRRHKLKCNVCGLIVSSIDSLKVHMILHTGESPYRCCLCEDQAFFSLSSLRHHQEGHKISKRFQCKNCKMRFSSRTELSKHKLTHEIKCGLCGDSFPNKTSRACHYRTAHPDDIKRCTECLGLFSTDEELQKHIRYHRKSKKEQCPVCGIVVTKLKDHMVIHSTVLGENLFECDQCPMKYTRKSSLNKHLLIHTGEKPYACSICPRKFRSNGMLRKHLLTHTLERPFVCGVCGKQFSLRSNLVTHMRIHSETKKYPCSYCLQGFNYKTSLEIHIKCKHSSADTSTVVSCVHCSQTFQDENSRIAHVCPNNMMAMKVSKEVNKEWEIMNLPEQPLSNEQEKQSSEVKHHQLSHSQKYPLKDLHDTLLSQKEQESTQPRQDQSLPFTNNLHNLSQDQSSTIRQEYHAFQRELPLQHRPYKPQNITIGQEATYINQESPMMPLLFSNPPIVNQSSNNINPYIPIHDSSMLSGFNPLDSSTSFQVSTSNIDFDRGFTPSNVLNSHDFGRERRTAFGHQSSTISSILSAPPTFRSLPTMLEQHSQSMNFSNVTPSNLQ